MNAARGAVVCALLTTLFGCGGDSSVQACFGDAVFCATAFNPIARAGADQTVASGDGVTLDGSASTGGGSSIKSYAWTQTAGPTVTLMNAASAKATFVAPNVASNTGLTFKLTVVNGGGRADSSNTVVTVQPPPAAAVASALALFDGPLQPTPDGTSPPGACESATARLPDDVAAAQTGLFLAARSLALANGADASDASAFFDAARGLTARPQAALGVVGTAGEVETFGFMLLETLAAERDPGLRDAVAVRLRGATSLDDPAALLGGRSDVVDFDGIRIEDTADPVAAQARAIALLLAARGTCPSDAEALQLSSAGLRVIAAMKPVAD